MSTNTKNDKACSDHNHLIITQKATPEEVKAVVTAGFDGKPMPKFAVENVSECTDQQTQSARMVIVDAAPKRTR